MLTHLLYGNYDPTPDLSVVALESASQSCAVQARVTSIDMTDEAIAIKLPALNSRFADRVERWRLANSMWNLPCVQLVPCAGFGKTGYTGNAISPRQSEV